MLDAADGIANLESVRVARDRDLYFATAGPTEGIEHDYRLSLRNLASSRCIDSLHHGPQRTGRDFIR